MIVVVIIGVLAMLAYPSYQEQVRQAKRATAQAGLMALSGLLERHFTVNNSYIPPAPSLTSVSHDDYLYSFSGSATATTFTLQTAPQGEQSKDMCGTLTLSNTGARTPSNNNCWK